LTGGAQHCYGDLAVGALGDSVDYNGWRTRPAGNTGQRATASLAFTATLAI
jgi:hypothetical protein